MVSIRGIMGSILALKLDRNLSGELKQVRHEWFGCFVVSRRGKEPLG